ncbi:hypothetical protein BN439_0212 [Erwinia amylovora Ea644]|uniref:Uncharacterized protein n=1 Tax=Erwinia amylovora ATCC BAA-2158 TaxID=889211 RepID=E5B0L9_ERWAM|nr:hypothetical protein predicted by Glimmer/Critica [Erwinia amylovora ATCC BAA-2158]CCP01313.1 hypothetical protein BN439_0212 [Erwinia amylovora Ea644]CCP05297.1 hypothetical protein BN440_0238 [Erwinia amylovora MR1]
MQCAQYTPSLPKLHPAKQPPAQCRRLAQTL